MVGELVRYDGEVGEVIRIFGADKSTVTVSVENDSSILPTEFIPLTSIKCVPSYIEIIVNAKLPVGPSKEPLQRRRSSIRQNLFDTLH